jgi:hypothetical protein
MPITEAQFKKIALSFPEAHEKSSYGYPAIFIAKKFFTRLRKEDDSIVLIVGSIDEREMMIESDPSTFHITQHYRDYPSVLVRIGRINEKTLRAMLERRWRAIAPKKLIKAIDGAGKSPVQAETGNRPSGRARARSSR